MLLAEHSIVERFAPEADMGFGRSTFEGFDHFLRQPSG